jgi:hypothetical protein
MSLCIACPRPRHTVTSRPAAHSAAVMLVAASVLWGWGLLDCSDVSSLWTNISLEGSPYTSLRAANRGHLHGSRFRLMDLSSPGLCLVAMMDHMWFDECVYDSSVCSYIGV